MLKPLKMAIWLIVSFLQNWELYIEVTTYILIKKKKKRLHDKYSNIPYLIDIQNEFTLNWT